MTGVYWEIVKSWLLFYMPAIPDLFFIVWEVKQPRQEYEKDTIVLPIRNPYLNTVVALTVGLSHYWLMGVLLCAPGIAWQLVLKCDFLTALLYGAATGAAIIFVAGIGLLIWDSWRTGKARTK